MKLQDAEYALLTEEKEKLLHEILDDLINCAIKKMGGVLTPTQNKLYLISRMLDSGELDPVAALRDLTLEKDRSMPWILKFCKEYGFELKS